MKIIINNAYNNMNSLLITSDLIVVIMDSDIIYNLCVHIIPVNLTVRVNPTKRESQQTKLERYFL